MWVEGCYGISAERGAYAGGWIEGWAPTGSDNKLGARMMFIRNNSWSLLSGRFGKQRVYRQILAVLAWFDMLIHILCLSCME